MQRLTAYPHFLCLLRHLHPCHDACRTTLNAAQETQQQLTAAQALHAGTLQQRLTHDNSSADENEKHQSLFKRLFRRKSY